VKREPKNIPASVRTRLLNLSKARQEDYNLTLTRYVSERFLYRLGMSQCRRDYVLKGAMLLTVSLDQLRYRPTRDIDMLRTGNQDEASIRADIETICSIDGGSDGLLFDTSHATMEEIRENNRYQGMRIRIPVYLGNARIRLQIDLGFGDVVYPPPQSITLKTLLNQSEPTVLAYPLEAVVAEKFEAILSIGMITSRMKDFFDIYVLATARNFGRAALLRSIEATFQRRNTQLPAAVPTVLGKELLQDPNKLAQWRAFAQRIERDPAQLSLAVVLEQLRGFLRIAWHPDFAASVSRWTPAEGWH
jgi:hypothetical protein